MREADIWNQRFLERHLPGPVSASLYRDPVVYSRVVTAPSGLKTLFFAKEELSCFVTWRIDFEENKKHEKQVRSVQLLQWFRTREEAVEAIVAVVGVEKSGALYE